MKRMLTYLLAFVVGIFPGFFIVFNSVFTDRSGALMERVVTFLLVILAYGAIGWVFGYFGRSMFKGPAIALSLPAVLILLLYSIREISLIPLNLLYIAVTIGSAYFGAYLGARVKNNR